ncbi:thioredoxin reductase [Mycobacteroides chelonae]|nr:thioredoxin reductase [Mycobacteroides chelonae]
MKKLWDVAIIGGGATELSAAITLARSRRSVLVIDDPCAMGALPRYPTQTTISMSRSTMSPRCMHGEAAQLARRDIGVVRRAGDTVAHRR